MNEIRQIEYRNKTKQYNNMCIILLMYVAWQLYHYLFIRDF